MQQECKETVQQEGCKERTLLASFLARKQEGGFH